MWGYTGCCGGYVPAAPFWYWPQNPIQYPTWSNLAPKELAANTPAPTAQVTIGGLDLVFLSLEYLKDAGAPVATIKISVTDSTGTAEWNITTIPDGFQTRLDLFSAVPGASVQLDVTGCTAQLKWLERVN